MGAMSLKKSLKKKFLVRFSHCDPAGILFFAHIFDVCHDLFEDYLEFKKIPYTKWFADPQYIYPLTSSHADFKKPMRLGETYLVEIKMTQLRTHSLEMTYHFTDNKNQTTALISSVHVCVDPLSQKKTPLPPQLVQLLS